MVVVLEVGRGRCVGGEAGGKQPHQHDSFMAGRKGEERSGKMGDGFVSKEAAPDAVQARERQAESNGNRRSLQLTFPPHAFHSHTRLVAVSRRW